MHILVCSSWTGCSRQKKQTLLLTCMETGHWRMLRVVFTSFYRLTISRLNTSTMWLDRIITGLMCWWLVMYGFYA